jgi:hypothetical protein
VTCDYCAEGIPVVCGDCGDHEDLHDWQWEHPFRPVHRIPDPEGIEGVVAVVPCGRAG